MTTVTDKKSEIPKTADKFFEIVNWKKAQEYMQGDNNFWCKLYTSILDNEWIISLDNISFRLLINLWVLAARLGTHIFPTDSKWLKRHMPYLEDEPDLKPLFNAKDLHGNPVPLVLYCEPPVKQQKNNTSSEDTKKTYSQKRGQKKEQQREKTDETSNDPIGSIIYKKAIDVGSKRGYVSANNLQKELKIGHPKALSIIDLMREKGLLGKYVNSKGYVYIASSEKTETEEKKVDKSREEQKREDTEILTDFGRKEKELNKTGLNPVSEKDQSKAKQNPSRAQTDQSKTEQTSAGPNREQSPLNPMESEVTAASSHHVPKQPSSAFRGGGAQHIGQIISGIFPEHWQDPEAEAFGWKIVEALGYSTDRKNPQSRSEWGSFASWWSNIKNTVQTQLHSELWDIAIKKAMYVNSPKVKSARNKSAVWFKIMRGELLSRGIAWPDSRASPA